MTDKIFTAENGAIYENKSGKLYKFTPPIYSEEQRNEVKEKLEKKDKLSALENIELLFLIDCMNQTPKTFW